MQKDGSFEGTVRDRRPKINENERAEYPYDDCHYGERNESAPPHRDPPVDDPCQDCQDDECNEVTVFQNKPVHIIALS
jgi:hypothetical protein